MSPTREAARAQAREQARALQGNASGVVSTANGTGVEESEDDRSLLLLLGRAVYTEALSPILRLPRLLTQRGTDTLKRINDTVTVSRRAKIEMLTLDWFARVWYDRLFSQPMMFLPSDLPPALIDRNVTRLQLDTNSKFRYIEEYDVIQDLGMGSSGRVYQVKDSLTGEQYAIKVLNKKILQNMQYGNHNLLKNVELEIKVMRQMGQHPNLLRLYEVMDAPLSGEVVLRIEYCEGGQAMAFDQHLLSCLSTWFTASPTSSMPLQITPLGEHVARCYFADLISGLDYLHQMDIVHRDIKPENLLLTADGRLKIADFGAATCFRQPGDDLIYEAAGTPAFQSPEAVIGTASRIPFSGQANDIWTAGVTLYVFVHGKVPFLALTSGQTYQMILHNTIPVSDDLSMPLRDLLFKLLDRDPKTRLTMEEIKNHPWMLNSN